MRLAPLCAPDVLPNIAMYRRGGFDAVMVSEIRTSQPMQLEATYSYTRARLLLRPNSQSTAAMMITHSTG